MRRSPLTILGGISVVIAVALAACFGPAEQEPSDSTGSEGAELRTPALDGNYALTTSTECPWTSDLDSSCAPGVSEKSCGGGSGKCRVSGSRGCTCVTGTTAEVDSGVVVVTQPAPVYTGTSDAGTTTSTECPWTSDLDSSCAPGVSEKSCGGGSGRCRVSGSLGCTCVSGTTATTDAGFPQ